MGLLKAVQSTVLKLDPTKQASELSAAQKAPLVAGATLSVEAASPTTGNHLQLTLTTPLQGYTTWFAYAPHVVVAWLVLEGVQETVLKRDPTKQASQLAEADKYSLPLGAKLGLAATAPAANNHVQVTLLEPLKGYVTWFAYGPHVRIVQDTGGKLEAARDRQKVFNAYLAIEIQEGSDLNHLSFLDRGLASSAYKDQVKLFADRLRMAPDGKTVVSLGSAVPLTGSGQTVLFGAFPNRGVVPAIDTRALDFLHPEITEACLCVGSVVDGQLRSRWLGRNALSNAQFWSATKIVAIANLLCQANTKAASIPIGSCTIVDSQGAVSARSFTDAAIDVVSYRKDDAAAGQFISNATAAMFKRFNSRPGLEQWFRGLTGSTLQFRGYYGESPLMAWPQLKAGTTALIAAPSEGTGGENLVSAYDLTRLMAMVGWHFFIPTSAKLPGAQWHSLATFVECLGHDAARYLDAAIATLGIAPDISNVVLLSKLGFGASDSRDRTELTYTALVQFVDARLQTASQPAILRTVALTLRAAVRRVNASGSRDLNEEARQIDARMAAEVTEILRRIVTQELA